MMNVLPQGKVERYYAEKLESDGAMLFSLIDPDKCFLEKGVAIAKESYEQGADVILLGGSIGAQGARLDETARMIKEEVSIPVVLFPGNISGLTPYADATYFMYMLNSRDVYWLSTAQIQGAPMVEKMGIEAIPTCYVVLEPGRTVGWIGNANLVPRERPDLAYACALAARYHGSHVLITDSGSGADVDPALDIISACAKAAAKQMFYFYAGGVRTPKQAGDIIKAGADGIQIGTAFETGEVGKKIKQMHDAIKAEGKKRV
ncbi:MAG: geranylgeranylglyceryl/heptaprenylglyceryl phosphate synthase [Candidatus Micrarchaeia archaeon]|jgi:phosphoglycerol geranylgeranyltransferase